MGKIGQNDTPSRKFFQCMRHHRRFLPPLLNVQNRAFWKPLSKIFLKSLRTSISNHRTPMRILPASPPVSGSILPATLLCKNRDKVAPPPENISARESSSNVQNRAFWKPLPEIFLKYLLTSISNHRSPRGSCRYHLLSAAAYSPLPFHVKIEAKWKPFLKIF